jgi:predicted nucleic acid-binding protein
MAAILDTGPLVAYLNRRDPYHAWAVEVMQQVKPPMLVCEAVLTEAAYFLREDGLDVDPLFSMVERGALQAGFQLERHWPRVRALMRRYRQMDLADACVVVMSELFPRSTVLTVDRRDFSVYRRGDRRVIPFVAPGQG